MTKTDTRRTDHAVSSSEGHELFVREVVAAAGATRRPILLLHGGRVPSVPSFDLPVPNGSLAQDLADAGHHVFLMDGRGFGYSTRPAGMQLEAERSIPEPLVRSDEVARDALTVVDWVRERTGSPAVGAFGWATGSHWLAMVAAFFPDRISHLAFYNTLYGADAPHPRLGRGSGLEDPERPGVFNAAAFGRYRLNTEADILGWWTETIPVEDKASWRDPAVVEAFVAEALASDATSGERTPPSFRSPSGVMEDAYYLASGRRYWDASLIKAHCLVIQGEFDFWSRPEDRKLLLSHLTRAASRDELFLAGSTHHAHLDRPDRGRDVLIERLRGFFA